MASATAIQIESKRVVTSAIEGLTVSRVRRGLDIMRKLWRERSTERPFFICRNVIDNYSMQQFAFKFVMGHHYKRHSKSKTANGQHGHVNVDADADLDEDVGDIKKPPPKRKRTCTRGV